MADPRVGDAARLQAQVAGRFGNGAVARTAAERALAARPGMFQTNNAPPSPLLGQRDRLAEEAAAVLGSSQERQDGYPYRYPSPTSTSNPPVQAYVAEAPGVGQPYMTPPPGPTSYAGSPQLHSQAPQPRPIAGIPSQYRGAVQAAQEALRHGSPQPGGPTQAAPYPAPGRHPGGAQQPSGGGHRTETVTASPGGSRNSSPGQQHSLSARIRGPTPTGRSRSPSPAPAHAGWQQNPPAWAAQAASPGSPARHPSPQSPQPAPASHQASPAGASPRVPSGAPSRRSSPGRRSVSPSGRVAGWNHQGGYTSHVDVRLESSENIRKMLHEHGEEFYRRYQVKQHRENHPDYAFTQRPSRRMITLAQQNIGFDAAHPALAHQHYLRSPEQELELAEERRRLAALKQRRARKDPGRRTSDSAHGTPSGTDKEGEDVQDHSRDVQQRAVDAIHVSRHITAKYRTRSASPGRGTRSPLSRYSPRITSRDDMSAGYPASDNYPEWMSDQEPMRAPRYQQQPAVQRKGWSRAGDDSNSLADHVARDTGERPADEPAVSSGPALTPDEFKLAAGVFSEDKFEEYNRQMDHEMELRAQQRGFDSDEERAEKAAAAAAAEALTDEQKAILAKQQEEARKLEALLQQSWQEQNTWMDHYRERLGSQEGYNTPPRSATGQSTDNSPRQHTPMLIDMMSPGSSGDLPYYQGSPGPLSPNDQQLADGAFVPLVSPDLHAEGYLYPRRGGYASDGGGGGGRRAAAARQSYTPTKPKPFAFEERAATRPKPIMQVKLEQDLAIRKQEEQTAKSYRFKAKPIPRSNSPGLYEQQMLVAEVRRQINKDSRLEQLAGLVEKPFSFQERDEQRAREAAALAEAAKHPDRFQIPFYAKPIPNSVKSEKFKYMMLELEAKRLGARERMEQARAKARQRVEADISQRQTKADTMYKERLRVVDPVWNQRYETQQPGTIPDFNLLHSQWEQRLAKLRALTRHNITVPREFGTHNARDPQEKAARDRKALERRQRILMDIALDSELLPEQRWPYKTPRGRVRPTPPPVMAEPDFKVSDTRANILRRAATATARKTGQYADPYERERRALLKARKEAAVRAAAYTKMKEGLKKGDMDDCGLSRTRDALKGGSDVPVMHLEARHAQAEKQARMEIEDVLLQTGVYNDLKYNEDKPRK